MVKLTSFIVDRLIIKPWGWFRQLPLYKQAGLAIGSILVVSFSISLASYLYFIRDISNQERLMNRKNTGVVLTDRHGEPFFTFYQAKYSDSIPISEIPDAVEQALIATEDRNFYEHNGYSFKSILAALYANVANQDIKKYGGSTITQQLVKNVLLKPDKSFIRKYQELSLAIAIERHYTKEQILEMYLNSVYFGEGAFGIEAAAQTYFSKPAKELSVAESSFLIGLLPAPSTYSPVSGDQELAAERQKLVLNQMESIGYISEQQKQTALARPVKIHFTNDAQNSYAQHFALMVMDELEEEYGEERIARSGFTVKTTLDLDKQKQMEEIIKNHITTIKASGADNGAAVAADPKTGEVLALAGSVDWFNKQYGKVNMATTPRQPGSSFKPIYYTKALEEKLITAATILKDEPTTFGGTYRPENYDFKYRGNITVRKALANSLNIPSVAILEKLGVEEGIAAAEDLGLSTLKEDQDYGLSLALGTGEVRLTEMVGAYGAFANGGQLADQHLVLEIKDKYKKQEFKAKVRQNRAVSEQAAFIISDILSDNQARAPTFGSSLTLDYPAAVKTGTTEDNRDGWTIGYTPSLVVGTWVGNNANKPMAGIGGSAGAAPIWRGVMSSFLKNQAKQEFKVPRRVEELWVCGHNGLPADSQFSGTYREYFIAGSAPNERCQKPVEPEKPQEKRRPENNNRGRGNNGREDKPEDDKPEEEPPEEEEPEEEEDNGDGDGDGNGNEGGGNGGAGGGNGNAGNEGGGP